MYLHSGCVYKLNIDGQEKVFNSEMELDAFLSDYSKSVKLDKINKTLSIDLQEDALQRLNEAKIEYDKSAIEIIRNAEDPEETEIYYKIPHSLGVTKFIGLHGNHNDINLPIIPPMNKDEWRIKKFNEYKAMGFSDEKINTLIDNLENKLWPEYGYIGTDIHKVFECVISDTEIPKLDHLNQAQINSVKVQAENFKQYLKDRYGEKAIFITEFAFKTKELDPSIKTILEASGFTSLNGKADLLVVDEYGQVHIFDYKVSPHNFGNREDWNIPQNDVRKKLNLVHSTKKSTVANQLAFYNAMLRQYGINVHSCNIIPIKLDMEFEDEEQTVLKKYDDGSYKFTETLNPIIKNVPQTLSGGIFNNVIKMVPVTIHTSNEETIDIIQKTNELFPNAKIETNVEQFKVEIEYYKKHPEVIQLKKVDRDNIKYKEDGYVYQFKTHGLPKETWVYAKDEQDLQDKLEKFVSDLSTYKTNELTNFANVLSECIESGENITSITDNFSERKRSFVTQQFKKYIMQQWEFVKDPNLNAAGFFIFKKDGISEVVVISNKQLLTTVNLGLGTSLLGKKVKNANINSKEIFDANYGNIEIMKAMYYISEHPDMFRHFKIAEVRCINPWSVSNNEVSNLNSSTIHNWNMLCMQNQELNLKQVEDECFLDDVNAALSIAKSKTDLVDEGFIDFQLVPNAIDMAYNEKWIMDTMKKLKGKHPELWNPENYNPDQDIWAAYVYLQKALLASQGIYTLNETTPGQYFTKGFNPNGFMVSAGQFSPSANIRVFSQIHDQYVAEVRTLVYKLGEKFQRAVKGFYDEEKQYGFLGARRDIFKSWFVTNSDGEITTDFRIKNPYSKEFDARPKTRAAMIEFVNLLYELKHPKPKDPALLRNWNLDLQESWENNDDALFEVPLTEARFENQRAELGWKKAIKNKWEQYKTLTRDVFAEDENVESKEYSGKTLKEEFEIKNQSVYNKFRLSGEIRKEKIEQHGIGFFEIDLESVLNQALVSYVKEEVSKKYVPIFQAMRLSLQHMKGYGSQTMQNTIDSFDKMLKSKFYGEPIMEDKLRPIYRYLNVLKKGFSMMTLGLNFSSMFRELLQGTFIGLSRSGVKMLPGLDVEHYLKGAGFVIKEAHKNFSSVSMLQQLNAQYGMANMSLSNIANQRRVDWFGIRNWNTDTMYITASSPDFQHRMAILVGKMMSDGCWEAHSLDEDGILKYDWKKDKRFEAYVNGKTDDPNYMYQKSLYLSYIREYNRIGYTKEDGSKYKEGDALPMAYPPKEQQSLKNFADLLYGHYDDESRALVNDTFIGAFFLQYKTFITAKLEQWTMNPGIYNTEFLKQQYDPITKDKLYIKYTYPNKDNTGVPTKKIIRESELTEEDKKSELVENYLKWEGQPMEGMFQSSMSCVKAIKNMDINELKLIWQDPLKKANTLLSLNDLLLCSLMTFLVNFLFSKMIGQDEWWNKAKTRQEIRNENWLAQWSYKVSIGAFEDGPVWNVVASMFSDVNPPLLTSMTKLVDTTSGLLVGDKTLAEAATQNIGAIREFQGLISKAKD